MQCLSSQKIRTDLQSLKSGISKAPEPRFIIRLLNDERIPVIGVHVFYPETNPKGSIKRRIPENYAQYKENVLQMLHEFSPAAWKQAIFLIESTKSHEATCKILKLNGINADGAAFYRSFEGEITAPSEETKEERGRFPFFDNAPAYGRILSAVQQKIVFTFGMFNGRLCLGRAGESLTAIAKNAGVSEFHIAQNELVCLPCNPPKLSIHPERLKLTR